MPQRRFTIGAEGFPPPPALMAATVDALKELGGSASNKEILDKVVEIEGVTEEEQSFMMPDQRRSRLDYYLHWARTFLKRGNILENSARGVWSLTERGRVSEEIDFRGIYDQVNLEERERRRRRQEEARENAAEGIPADEGDPDSDGVSEGGGWKTELLGVLLQMPPDAFERLVQRLLREAGFTRVEVRGKSGDGGIDGVGVLRVNLVSFQVFFQCKRWQGSVGAREIRDFRGAMMGRADKGLFITTGAFTSQAFDEATRDGATAIDLIDGDRLCDLLRENGLGTSVELVPLVTIDQAWFHDL